MTAIIHGVTYCDELIDECKAVNAPCSGCTVSGYGRKIPTGYMVRIGKQWYRVYAICYGNAASHYIVRQKQRLFINHSEILKG